MGGAELQLERLVPHLLARGVETEIVTRAVSGWPRTEPIAGSVVRRTRVAGESPLAALVYVASALGHLLRRRSRIDLVHAHGALSPATIALAGRVLGLPCLVTVLGTGPHGDLARLAGKPLGGIRSRLLLRCAWFAALSTDARDELLRRGVDAGRILALPNGVDVAGYRPATTEERLRLRERLGLPRDGFVGTFVGRLHPVKDVDTLLGAAALVPGLTLVVIGDGPERARLEAQAASLGIGSRVSFRGESSEVPELLRASDAFLLSTHGEGMSNALLEGMACGLPCLASRSVGGAAELLGAGRGVLLPDADVPAWAAAVQRLIDEPPERESMGTAAAAFVAAELSLEAAADRLVRAYELIAS
ncbi:MAG: alpha-maltose-phosphate synthase [Thermoleophilaceae bacterium]|nr:alpha-maltose-phosphate synthase [Thermoleophilaceae bacterium]